MLRNLLTLLACSLLLHATAQAQYWMQHGGSLNVDEALDVVVDGSGNSYATGYFTGTASFGTTNLTSSGSSDIFVVKVNSSGVFQWARRAGGGDNDRGLSIALDDSANVVITGYFNGTAAFGTQSVTATGQQDVFIAKYSTDGTFQWVRRAGGSDADIGSGIAVDNNDNIVVTGEFKGSSTFGTTTLTSQNSSTDVFITKLSPGGNFLWTQQGAGDQTDRGVDVGCDGSGNIYAIGQFSDTFSFDQTHNNQMFNAVYVSKFNANGVEQWFKIIGGGSSVFAYAIDVNSAGNQYITGDFSGNITFFNTSNVNLSNSYDNGVFVAKYTANGVTSWAAKAGSDNAISSRGIGVDNSGNAYIVGHFECSLDEYTAEYGDATFNSVGYEDIFVARFTNSGSFSWGRHIGSRGEDYGHGIDVNSTGKPHIAGSFKSSLHIPTTGNFLASNLSNWTQNSCTGNNGHCNDNHYGNFYSIPSNGNSDAVIANCIDPNRAPYDYYLRGSSGCDKSIIPGCINNCEDTLYTCNTAIVNAVPKTCPNIGPAYNFLWSNGSNLNSTYFGNEGNKWLRFTTKDGCFQTFDTTYVKIHPLPDQPYVEDDVVINTPTPFPVKVDVCLPDTVTLTGSNITTDSAFWLGPGLPASGYQDSVVSVTESGVYTFVVVDENNCMNSTQIDVEFFHPLDSFVLKANVPDTIVICDNEDIVIHLYDTVDNPSAETICFTDSQPYVNTTFSWSPSSWLASEGCETFLYVTPEDTGWFYFEATVILRIPCDTDTHYVQDSIYVIPLPSPEMGALNVTMQGSNYYCPGSTCLQVGMGGGSSYVWTGPFVNGTVADSLYIGVDGTYSVSSTIYDTNQYGCIDSVTGTAVKQISEKPQPEIQASSLIICPNDTVWITALNTGANMGFFWEGPSGPINQDSGSIAATEPGTYYVVVNDSDSCDLTSNSIILSQYTTPSLAAAGDLVICDGDSVTLSVISNAGSQLQWLPPLSGSETEKTVYEPGTYTCKIVSCGIETYATIVVSPSYVESEITYEGVLCLDSFMVLHGTDSMHTYQWSHNNTGTDSIIISQPGTYTLTTTDTNGCEKVSDPVTITIDQDPAAISITGYPVLCEFDTMTLYGNADMEVYHWSTGDTTQQILITDDGTYTLWARDTNGCRGLSNPLTITTPDTIARYDVEGELAFCEGDSVKFRAKKGKLAEYLWLPDSLYGRTIYLDTTGSYWLFTTDTFGCEAWSEPVEVYMQPNEIDKPLVDDTLICENSFASLVASTNIGAIKWSERPFGRVIHEGPFYETPKLNFPMSYFVWSDFELCRSDSSEVHVATMDCYNAHIPNVFTPNGDGINEFFTIHLNEIQCFHLYMYNRWGVLLYESHDVETGWDGTVQRSGEPVPEGTYYYLLEYCRFDGSDERLTGFVTVIRE